jgi:hypothetical protein
MVPGRHDEVLDVDIFMAVSSFFVLVWRKFGNELSLRLDGDLWISFGGSATTSSGRVSDSIDATPKKDPDPLTEKIK